MKLTSHAQTRMQQRSVRDQDLALISRYGTEFEDGLVHRRVGVHESRGVVTHQIRSMESPRERSKLQD